MAEEKDKVKEAEKDMTKEYEALKKKYYLPELKELDKEFCIGKLEDTQFILRTVIGKIMERIELVFKTLSDIVQPAENNLATMYEAEVFSDDEKKHIFDLMKKLAYTHRDLIIKDYEYSDDTAAVIILKAFKEWKEMKKDVLRIMEKLRDSWKSDNKSKAEEGYFG
jgi:hypothetical protein